MVALATTKGTSIKEKFKEYEMASSYYTVVPEYIPYFTCSF